MDREAVCAGRCGESCSCKQIQIRLIVRKMRRDFSDQWSRVESHYRSQC